MLKWTKKVQVGQLVLFKFEILLVCFTNKKSWEWNGEKGHCSEIFVVKLPNGHKDTESKY